MPDEPEEVEVPDGAAVFPNIPAELGVHPYLLAVLHAVVFIGGSEPTIVQPAAGDEALGMMAEYLGRLTGDDLRRAREDLDALASFARQQGWPKQLTTFLRSFQSDFGLSPADDA